MIPILLHIVRTSLPPTRQSNLSLLPWMMDQISNWPAHGCPVGCILNFLSGRISDISSRIGQISDIGVGHRNIVLTEPVQLIGLSRRNLIILKDYSKVFFISSKCEMTWMRVLYIMYSSLNISFVRNWLWANAAASLHSNQDWICSPLQLRHHQLMSSKQKQILPCTTSNHGTYNRW